MITKASIFLIKFYQQTLSPFKGACCIYSPSCSEYARQHIVKYGLMKSVAPISKRIVSCNPLSKKPHWDPVK
tara:strand:+ start:104 stop:319 length:216 start_codon:yes stop_codon:yes gene_type:complete